MKIKNNPFLRDTILLATNQEMLSHFLSQHSVHPTSITEIFGDYLRIIVISPRGRSDIVKILLVFSTIELPALLGGSERRAKETFVPRMIANELVWNGLFHINCARYTRSCI